MLSMDFIIKRKTLKTRKELLVLINGFAIFIKKLAQKANLRKIDN